MASLRFYLERRRDAHGHIRKISVPIILSFSFEGKRLQLTTGERIDFSDWDFQRQRALTDARGAKQLNRYLDSLGEGILELYRESRALGLQPGPEYLRQQLRYKRRRGKVSFLDVYMRFIDENNAHWSLHTFRKIRTCYNHLIKFSETEGIDIEFNRIDRDFLDRYVRFFRIKYGHSNNTISKNLDVLKWFLNWAAEKGYNQSTLYRDYRFEWPCKPRIAQEDLVLDWKELMKLQKFEPDTERMAEVRDIFCFSCYTGLQLSKVNELKSEDVLPCRILYRENEFHFQLPINEHANRIVDRYREKKNPGGRCFPHFHHSEFNRYLKRLGKMAGINAYVRMELYAGLEKGYRHVPKYEILSSKIAVNTFLFNALKLGISPEVLSFIAGRKTRNSVNRILPLLEHAANRDIRKFDRLPANSD